MLNLGKLLSLPQILRRRWDEFMEGVKLEMHLAEMEKVGFENASLEVKNLMTLRNILFRLKYLTDKSIVLYLLPGHIKVNSDSLFDLALDVREATSLIEEGHFNAEKRKSTTKDFNKYIGWQQGQEVNLIPKELLRDIESLIEVLVELSTKDSKHFQKSYRICQPIRFDLEAYLILLEGAYDGKPWNSKEKNF